MKILVILGTRKNGNTEEIVKYFEKKTCELIECEFEYLYLHDYNIDFCTGCHNCIFIGEDKCPHYSDVKLIEDKILYSDVVILATPGYMFSVTGIMKNFLDHVAYNCHRPKYFGKKAFLISSCTKWQEKSVFSPMETWIKGAGFSFAGKVYVDILPFPLNKEEINKRRKTLEKAAKKFHSELKNLDEIKLDFGNIMIFHAFKTLCKIAPSILQADYEYFKNKNAYEKDTKWYIPVKVPKFKHYLGKYMGKKMEKDISKMIDFEIMENDKNGFKNKL